MEKSWWLLWTRCWDKPGRGKYWGEPGRKKSRKSKGGGWGRRSANELTHLWEVRTQKTWIKLSSILREELRESAYTKAVHEKSLRSGENTAENMMEVWLEKWLQLVKLCSGFEAPVSTPAIELSPRHKKYVYEWEKGTECVTETQREKLQARWEQREKWRVWQPERLVETWKACFIRLRIS